MRFRIFLVCLSAAFLFLTGCNVPQRPAAEPTAEIPEATELPPEPTETPTPLPAQEKIVFITSSDAPGVSENLRTAMDAVCGAGFDCQEAASEDGLSADTDYAVFAKEPTALSSLTERFPQTRFILVTAPDTELQNAWTIRYDEAFFPFLAGLATVSSASDWRSAGLIPSDSAVWGSHAEEAFLNGAHYLCGNCRGVLSPYVEFPIVISQPKDSSPDSWSSRFDEAQNSFIYTAFLSDEAISEALLQKMVTLNVRMLGVSAPPAGLENNWLATVRFDWAETLRQIIARSEAGETQGSMGVVLSITPGALTESFSEGKANVLRNSYADLLSGKLSAYTASTEYTE